MRNVEAYVERLSARITDGGLDKWWDAVDAAMDEYIDMHRTMPGFRTLHFGDVVDTNLLDEERDNNAVIVEQLGNILKTQFHVTDGPKLTFALSMAVEIADALVKAAFRYQPDGDERILTEAKDIVREYLYRKLS